MQRPAVLPEQFQLVFSACASELGLSEPEFTDAARSLHDIVYVFVGGDGTILRVGQTRHSFHERWSRPINWLDVEHPSQPKRGNEISDMNKIREALVGRDSVSVWAKTTESITLDYLGSPERVSSRLAEEAYLDRVLKPLVGQPLNQTTVRSAKGK